MNRPITFFCAACSVVPDACPNTLARNCCPSHSAVAPVNARATARCLRMRSWRFAADVLAPVLGSGVMLRCVVNFFFRKDIAPCNRLERFRPSGGPPPAARSPAAADLPPLPPLAKVDAPVLPAWCSEAPVFMGWPLARRMRVTLRFAARPKLARTLSGSAGMSTATDSSASDGRLLAPAPGAALDSPSGLAFGERSVAGMLPLRLLRRPRRRVGFVSSSDEMGFSWFPRTWRGADDGVPGMVAATAPGVCSDGAGDKAGSGVGSGPAVVPGSMVVLLWTTARGSVPPYGKYAPDAGRAKQSAEHGHWLDTHREVRLGDHCYSGRM